MKRILAALAVALCGFWLPPHAAAQQPQQVVPCVPATSANGFTTVCINATAANPFPTTQGAVPAGSGTAGYPPGATPVQNSATGTTAGATATLPASASGQFTYLCGLHVEAGTATAAVTVNVTTTGLGSNFATAVNSPATAATATAGPVVSQVFTPCLKSSATNTAITVSASALGAGGVNQDVNAWGFQQ